MRHHSPLSLFDHAYNEFGYDQDDPNADPSGYGQFAHHYPEFGHDQDDPSQVDACGQPDMYGQFAHRYAEFGRDMHGGRRGGFMHAYPEFGIDAGFRVPPGVTLQAFTQSVAMNVLQPNGSPLHYKGLDTLWQICHTPNFGNLLSQIMLLVVNGTAGIAGLGQANAQALQNQMMSASAPPVFHAGVGGFVMPSGFTPDTYAQHVAIGILQPPGTEMHTLGEQEAWHVGKTTAFSNLFHSISNYVANGIPGGPVTTGPSTGDIVFASLTGGPVGAALAANTSSTSRPIAVRGMGQAAADAVMTRILSMPSPPVHDAPASSPLPAGHPASPITHVTLPNVGTVVVKPGVEGTPEWVAKANAAVANLLSPSVSTQNAGAQQIGVIYNTGVRVHNMAGFEAVKSRLYASKGTQTTPFLNWLQANGWSIFPPGHPASPVTHAVLPSGETVVVQPGVEGAPEWVAKANAAVANVLSKSAATRNAGAQQIGVIYNTGVRVHNMAGFEAVKSRLYPTMKHETTPFLNWLQSNGWTIPPSASGFPGALVLTQVSGPVLVQQPSSSPHLATGTIAVNQVAFENVLNQRNSLAHQYDQIRAEIASLRRMPPVVALVQYVIAAPGIGIHGDYAEFGLDGASASADILAFQKNWNATGGVPSLSESGLWDAPTAMAAQNQANLSTVQSPQTPVEDAWSAPTPPANSIYAPDPGVTATVPVAPIPSPFGSDAVGGRRGGFSHRYPEFGRDAIGGRQGGFSHRYREFGWEGQINAAEAGDPNLFASAQIAAGETRQILVNAVAFRKLIRERDSLQQLVAQGQRQLAALRAQTGQAAGLPIGPVMMPMALPPAPPPRHHGRRPVVGQLPAKPGEMPMPVYATPEVLALGPASTSLAALTPSKSPRDILVNAAAFKNVLKQRNRLARTLDILRWKIAQVRRSTLPTPMIQYVIEVTPTVMASNVSGEFGWEGQINAAEAGDPFQFAEKQIAKGQTEQIPVNRDSFQRVIRERDTLLKLVPAAERLLASLEAQAGQRAPGRPAPTLSVALESHLGGPMVVRGPDGQPALRMPRERGQGVASRKSIAVNKVAFENVLKMRNSLARRLDLLLAHLAMLQRSEMPVATVQYVIRVGANGEFGWEGQINAALAGDPWAFGAKQIARGETAEIDVNAEAFQNLIKDRDRLFFAIDRTLHAIAQIEARSALHPAILRWVQTGEVRNDDDIAVNTQAFRQLVDERNALSRNLFTLKARIAKRMRSEVPVAPVLYLVRFDNADFAQNASGEFGWEGRINAAQMGDPDFAKKQIAKGNLREIWVSRDGFRRLVKERSLLLKAIAKATATLARLEGSPPPNGGGGGRGHGRGDSGMHADPPGITAGVSPASAAPTVATGGQTPAVNALSGSSAPAAGSTPAAAAVNATAARLQARALELAKALMAGNVAATTGAQEMSLAAVNGDWTSRQLLDATRLILLKMDAPYYVKNAVEWRVNGLGTYAAPTVSASFSPAVAALSQAVGNGTGSPAAHAAAGAALQAAGISTTATPTTPAAVATVVNALQQAGLPTGNLPTTQAAVTSVATTMANAVATGAAPAVGPSSPPQSPAGSPSLMPSGPATPLSSGWADVGPTPAGSSTMTGDSLYCDLHPEICARLASTVRSADLGDQVSMAQLAKLRQDALAGNADARAQWDYAMRCAHASTPQPAFGVAVESHHGARPKPARSPQAHRTAAEHHAAAARHAPTPKAAAAHRTAAAHHAAAARHAVAAQHPAMPPRAAAAHRDRASRHAMAAHAAERAGGLRTREHELLQTHGGHGGQGGLQTRERDLLMTRGGHGGQGGGVTGRGGSGGGNWNWGSVTGPRSGNGSSRRSGVPLQQLLQAAADGNRGALARIDSIKQGAARGDRRAVSLLDALRRIAAGGNSDMAANAQAVSISHGAPLTSTRVNGIAAEFGADSVFVLEGVRAPHAPIAVHTDPVTRKAIAFGQILGKAQELQAVRMPGGPLPKSVAVEVL